VRVFEALEQISEEIGRTYVRKYKIHKQGIFALSVFFQDAFRNPNFKLDRESVRKLAKYVTEKSPKAEGKSSSGVSNAAYYETWREQLPDGIGLKLDPNRLFNESQRDELYRQSGGKCARCQMKIDIVEGECDHYPIPHRDGGSTTIENGRFVCKSCHARGRPKLPTLA
jgi:hypothetical protein